MRRPTARSFEIPNLVTILRPMRLTSWAALLLLYVRCAGGMLSSMLSPVAASPSKQVEAEHDLRRFDAMRPYLLDLTISMTMCVHEACEDDRVTITHQPIPGTGKARRPMPLLEPPSAPFRQLEFIRANFMRLLKINPHICPLRPGITKI
jgi:hypothetical protein